MILRVSPRAQRMRLHVDPRTRAVTLTVPKRMSRRRALAWAAGHRAWVERALAAIPEAVPFAPGAIVPLYGLPHRLDWDPARPRRIERGEGRLVAGGPADGLERRLLRWLKAHALDLLGRETREFAHRGRRQGRRGSGSAIRCRAGAAARARARSATAGG